MRRERPISVMFLAVVCILLCVAVFGWILAQKWAEGDLIWRARVRDIATTIPRFNGFLSAKLFPTYGLVLLLSGIGIWSGWRWARTLFIAFHVLLPVLCISEVMAILDGNLAPILFVGWAITGIIILMLPSSNRWFGITNGDDADVSDDVGELA